MPALQILYHAMLLLRRDSDDSDDEQSVDEVEQHKSPQAALIGGVVAGLVALVMLVAILVLLWRTRSKSTDSEGLPISRSAPHMQRINSMSTTGNGSRTPRVGIMRTATFASSISGVIVEGGILNLSRQDDRSDSQRSSTRFEK